MKEFDLEKAKNGAKVCTRDGREARIICFDMNNVYPIVALVRDEEGGEILKLYYSDGTYLIGEEKSKWDLMLAGEKKEGWVNIYRGDNGNPYPGKVRENKETAIKERCSGCVDTIHTDRKE